MSLNNSGRDGAELGAESGGVRGGARWSLGVFTYSFICVGTKFNISLGSSITQEFFKKITKKFLPCPQLPKRFCFLHRLLEPIKVLDEPFSPKECF